MKKYRLLKEYQFCNGVRIYAIKQGQIITNDREFSDGYGIPLPTNVTTLIPKLIVENNPEYFQEIKEVKEFEPGKRYRLKKRWAFIEAGTEIRETWRTDHNEPTVKILFACHGLEDYYFQLKDFDEYIEEIKEEVKYRFKKNIDYDKIANLVGTILQNGRINLPPEIISECIEEVKEEKPIDFTKEYKQAKERAKVLPATLKLFKVCNNIFTDGQALGKTYKVEQVGDSTEKSYEEEKIELLKDLRNSYDLFIQKKSHEEKMNDYVEKFQSLVWLNGKEREIIDAYREQTDDVKGWIHKIIIQVNQALKKTNA